MQVRPEQRWCAAPAKPQRQIGAVMVATSGVQERREHIEAAFAFIDDRVYAAYVDAVERHRSGNEFFRQRPDLAPVAKALVAADRGDIEPVRAHYPHLAPYLHLPPRKRGKYKRPITKKMKVLKIAKILQLF